MLEPSDVVVEQCADTLRPGGRDDQTGVVRLADPADDFRILVRRRCPATPAAPARARCPPGPRGLAAAHSCHPRRRSSVLAHSRQRFTPVAASTTSTMYAPPTRADVSRNSQQPSRAWMNSVCEAPRPSRKLASTLLVQGAQRGRRRIARGQRGGHEDPAFVRNRHRRHPVAAGHRKPNATVERQSSRRDRRRQARTARGRSPPVRRRALRVSARARRAMRACGCRSPRPATAA